MIPETQNTCQPTESTLTGQEVADKTEYPTEEDVAVVTAWKRYLRFVEIVESQGIQYNKQLTLEAMFRGNDLFYTNHYR